MSRTFLRLSLVWIFVIIQACAPTGVPTVDPNSIGTFIAQTVAAYTPTSAGIPVTGDNSPTPTQTVTTTPTVATPSPTSIPSVTSTAISLMTSTQSITLTPLVTSTLSLAPGVVQISVSVPTNCRIGPGVAYARVGALLVGEVAEVIGRHAAGSYWVIRNPDRANDTCWLWGRYATVVGDTNILPILTPPPPPPTATPSPAFDIAYEGLESCTGTGWWVDLGLENLGGVSFRSLTFTIRNLDTDVSQTQYTDGFINRNGCSESETRDTLAPGDSRTVSSPVLTANPSGHRLQATITLCSNNGQNGTCITQTVNVRP
jgi:hypothetical protein